MKTPCGKHNINNRFSPYFNKKESVENQPKISKPCLFSYGQACAILKAIELNNRKKLSKQCIAHLAVFVSHAWEEKPCPEKIKKVYYMINNLLDTTNMDTTEPFEVALQKFCASPVSTPTICSSVTLLVAISYIERLNKRYKDLKGTAGCSLRMIMVAYIMASKYIHDSLQLIIYTNKKSSTAPITNKPITPPTSPKRIFITSPQEDDSILSRLEKEDALPQKDEFPTAQDRNIRIARMELEFLHFLNYDLSVQDPVTLIKWAQNYEQKEETQQQDSQDYTSADEGGDEMDEDESL